MPHAEGPPLVLLDAEGPQALAAARELFLEYARSLDFSLCFQGFDAELAGLPGDYGPPDGALLLAWRGAEPVGCVGLRRLDPAAAELKRLYVRPAGRGSGVGRRLAEACVERARRLGYRELKLDTVPSMQTARALYDALGFREVAPYRANPVPGAAYLALTL